MRLNSSPWLAGVAGIVMFPLLFILSGCATNPVTGKQDFVLMSESQEIALGRKYSAEVAKQMPAYDSPELAAYVQKVGKRLASLSHRSNLVYRFTLVDDTTVNAFALPGGYIYITRGLLAYLNSEAELAAVLGHEIGHVTARHSVRQQSMSTATGLLGAIAASAAGIQGGQDLANVVGSAIVRGYGRGQELEADRLGAEYLARAGYDPQAMLSVIRVLKNQETFEKQRAREEGREPRSYHGLFSTHPDNDRRLQEVIGAAEKFRSKDAVRINRNGFLRRLDGLVFGDSEREGVRRGNRFYHRPLDFALVFPDGWRVENHPDRLLAFPSDRSALMQMTMQDINRRISPRRFLTERLGLKGLQQGRSIRAGSGVEGYTAIASSKTPFGTRPSRFTVLYHGDKAAILVGATRAQGGLRNMDPAFLVTARSFHRLNKKEKALARAQHIHLIKARTGARYRDLSKKSPIPNHPEAQLRLLNGDYPNGEPKAGTLLKIVE